MVLSSWHSDCESSVVQWMNLNLRHDPRVSQTNSVSWKDRRQHLTTLPQSFLAVAALRNTDGYHCGGRVKR